MYQTKGQMSTFQAEFPLSWAARQSSEIAGGKPPLVQDFATFWADFSPWGS
jgi:hypothetical protein